MPKKTEIGLDDVFWGPEIVVASWVTWWSVVRVLIGWIRHEVRSLKPSRSRYWCILVNLRFHRKIAVGKWPIRGIKGTHPNLLQNPDTHHGLIINNIFPFRSTGRHQKLQTVPHSLRWFGQKWLQYPSQCLLSCWCKFVSFENLCYTNTRTQVPNCQPIYFAWM